MENPLAGLGGIPDTVGMEIRSLNEADAGAYWRVRQQALEEEPLAFGKGEEEHRVISMEETKEWRLGSSPEGNFSMGLFLGGEGGTRVELVGIATFVRGNKRKERHKGHLVGVFLAARARGKGLGEALLRAVIARVSEDAGVEQILLGVSSTQEAAMRLYGRLGFARYGTEPRALKVGATYVDEHLMILRLR